ncbi:MAG: rhomboid family intramembrane serine protease [Planctomycetaceae bacterium]|nr:rhomboid family intramembrane serine protease [Planctomycetaceae bacterium]
MIPLRDNIASERTPIVNMLMIGICSLVFLGQMMHAGPDGSPGLTAEFGMIPYRISHPGEPFDVPVGARLIQTNRGVEQELIWEPAPPPAVTPLLTMFTCIFLHGGWMHILGNMWFLWIFGDNIEDRLGHLGFALFYVASGLAASAAHYLTDSASQVPTIGASGAIAGVMGAYFVWYTHSRVHSLIPVFGFLQFVEIPAPFFLGIWFLMQFLQGSMTAAEGGGVAWWAHIGGFVFGVGIALLMKVTGAGGPTRMRREAPRFQHRQGEW